MIPACGFSDTRLSTGASSWGYTAGGWKVTVEAETIHSVRVLRLDVQAIDAQNYQDVKARIRDLVGDSRRVVLDFGPVRFVDSAGLGVLLSLFRLVNERDGALAFSRVGRPVHTMFDLVRLGRIVEIFETTEEAVLALERS